MAYNREKLVSAWINFQKTISDDKPMEKHQDFWAMLKLCDLVYNNPEETWIVILSVLQKDQSDKIIGMLGVGPLEELLGEHGEKFIDRVEEQASKNPVFRHMLGVVWKNSMTEKIWERVEKARLYKQW